MNLLLTVVVIVCALGMIAVLMSRRSRAAEDGVAEFKRQLGALSPDASRPVIRPRTETPVPTDEESDDGA